MRNQFDIDVNVYVYHNNFPKIIKNIFIYYLQIKKNVYVFLKLL